MSTDGPVAVAVVGSIVEAQLIAGMLQSYGIRALVSADDVGGWEPQLRQSQGVRVLVRADDAEQARELIESADDQPADDR
jgi:hypothetical protein